MSHASVVKPRDTCKSATTPMFVKMVFHASTNRQGSACMQQERALSILHRFLKQNRPRSRDAKHVQVYSMYHARGQRAMCCFSRTASRATNAYARLEAWQALALALAPRHCPVLSIIGTEHSGTGSKLLTIHFSFAFRSGDREIPSTWVLAIGMRHDISQHCSCAQYKYRGRWLHVQEYPLETR